MKHWKTLLTLSLLAVAGCASQPPQAYENHRLVGSALDDFKPSVIPDYNVSFNGYNGRRVKGYDGGYNYGGYPEFIDWHGEEYYQMSYNSWIGYSGRK